LRKLLIGLLVVPVLLACIPLALLATGTILLLRRDADGDGDGDGHPDSVTTLMTGLRRPPGMGFAGDWPYIAESNRIGRVRFDSAIGETKLQQNWMIATPKKKRRYIHGE